MSMSACEEGGGAAQATWLSLAFDEIRRRDLPDGDELRDVLRAFGQDDRDAPGPASLDPDGHDGESTAARLQRRIAAELRDEVDADQASMFGRRFASVSTLLAGGERGGAEEEHVPPTRRLLRLALHRRTAQILAATDPALSRRKALRVRALVDFIWSLSLVLGLREDGDAANRPTLAELVRERGLRSPSAPAYRPLAPGFRHATLEGTTSDCGPVHINVLRVDLRASGCRLRCEDARRTSTDLAALAARRGAVAAISGGFFLYSEPDVAPPSARTDPVGLLVTDGVVRGPPVFRRAALVQKADDDGAAGTVHIEKVGMEGVQCRIEFTPADRSVGKHKQRFLDLTVGRDGVKCIHRASADEAEIEKGQLGFAIVGTRICFIVVAQSATKLGVPLAGFVLTCSQRMVPDGIHLKSEAVNLDISYELPRDAMVANAMAGGPMFFSDDPEHGCPSMDLPSEDFCGSAPPVTFSQDETHDHNLLPRMGLGLARGTGADGGDELVCVAVDGRNLDRALGLTLRGTAELLRALGCAAAMNLDGGSSKRMVVRDPATREHRVVCLSTTEIKARRGVAGRDGAREGASEPSRPVHSAILFLPGAEGR